jgi:glutamate/tyrosine decarboxylase-like PLP-dependent enzyme
MHHWGPDLEEIAAGILGYVLARAREDPPLDGPMTPAELRAATGDTITPSGIGGPEALRLWDEVLSRACVSQDHPRMLSFVPSAASEVSMLFDALVGASSVFGGSWLESAGAAHAENEALRWLADLAGFPPGAGGTFVSGGTAGNLSALVAARHHASAGRDRTARWRVAASAETHSSVAAAARVMDIDVVDVAVDDRGRMTGAALDAALDGDDDGVFAVVGTGGTTNAGQVDDLAGIAEVARRRGLWFHVDAAYGGAALATPRTRPLFDGIEHADSYIVDPHKWLFAPFDCCALVWRDPAQARATFTQHAAYLDTLHRGEDEGWNPSDLAYHLSRRARGLPFWFSLAVHGTDAYRTSVDLTLDTTQAAARLIEAADHTELVLEPTLSVVLFRRVGWTADQYHRWSRDALERGVALCVPSGWSGETVLRFCIVNPRTGPDDIALVLDDLRDWPG